jgi:phosphoribosyl-AMP cyclohydrolase
MSDSCNPFLRLDSPNYSEMLTDAVVHVLQDRGVERLSLGGIARWMGVTPSTVIQRVGPKAVVLERVLGVFARRWLAWAGWPELGRVLAWARQEERELLGRELDARLDRRATEAEVDTTYALLEGLRCALAVPAPTLTAERARSLLASHVDGLGISRGSTRDTGEVTSLDPAIAERLKRSSDGLVPAVVQQHDTGEVLMLGWMDDEALARTLTTGRATYWSRSRREYWVKGETSGNRQWVKEVRLDCDGDTLLVKVDQEGAACHTGDRTCFDADLLGP